MGVARDDLTMALPPDSLTTGRLVLRRLTVADAPVLAESVAASLERLLPWMPWAAREPVTIEERCDSLSTWQRLWDEGSEFHYGAFIGDAHLATVGVHQRGAADTLEIGYWAHVDHTGHGYVTEAVAALTTVALAQPDVDRVEICHDRANLASGAVPHRLGFSLARDEPRRLVASSESGITRCWEMRRRDWPTARSALETRLPTAAEAARAAELACATIVS
jgi:RimJ/RimL family protein N-acetyltransferase